MTRTRLFAAALATALAVVALLLRVPLAGCASAARPLALLPAPARVVRRRRIGALARAP
jgi:hypothetical protein